MTYREFKIKFGFVAAPQVTEEQTAPDKPPANVEAPGEPSQPAKAEAPAPDKPPAKKRSHHKKR